MTISARSGLGWAPIAEVDPELWQALLDERDRQRLKIEMIASENYAFAAVMDAHGGHLTHGSPVNFSGKWFEVHAYGVREDDARIDYEALERQAAEVRPKVIVAGASAYPRIIDFERMARIAHDVEALLFVDMAHIAGLVAAGVH